MTKTLAELQALCDRLGIVVPPRKRAAKEPYLHALRNYFWNEVRGLAGAVPNQQAADTVLKRLEDARRTP